MYIGIVDLYYTYSELKLCLLNMNICFIVKISLNQKNGLQLHNLLQNYIGVYFVIKCSKYIDLNQKTTILKQKPLLFD